MTYITIARKSIRDLRAISMIILSALFVNRVTIILPLQGESEGVLSLLLNQLHTQVHAIIVADET